MTTDTGLLQVVPSFEAGNRRRRLHRGQRRRRRHLRQPRPGRHHRRQLQPVQPDHPRPAAGRRRPDLRRRRHATWRATTPATSYARTSDMRRDADTILGDNGNIFRLIVDAGSDVIRYGFNYDRLRRAAAASSRGRRSCSTTRRAGPTTPTCRRAARIDIGAADEIHGESGDDFIYGMVGQRRPVRRRRRTTTSIGGCGQRLDLRRHRATTASSATTAASSPAATAPRRRAALRHRGDPAPASSTHDHRHAGQDPAGDHQRRPAQLKKTVDLDAVQPRSDRRDSSSTRPDPHMPTTSSTAAWATTSCTAAPATTRSPAPRRCTPFYRSTPANPGNVLRVRTRARASSRPTTSTTRCAKIAGLTC